MLWLFAAGMMPLPLARKQRSMAGRCCALSSHAHEDHEHAPRRLGERRRRALDAAIDAGVVRAPVGYGGASECGFVG